MSDEYIDIPGLGQFRKDHPMFKKDVQSDEKKKWVTDYGFPYGRYLIGGVRYWFKYNPKTMGVTVQKMVDGKWSKQIGRQENDKAVAEIKKDPLAEAIKYGKEIGACAICGKPLTSAESLEYGIGPDCARNAFTL